MKCRVNILTNHQQLSATMSPHCLASFRTFSFTCFRSLHWCAQSAFAWQYLSTTSSWFFSQFQCHSWLEAGPLIWPRLQYWWLLVFWHLYLHASSCQCSLLQTCSKPWLVFWLVWYAPLFWSSSLRSHSWLQVISKPSGSSTALLVCFSAPVWSTSISSLLCWQANTLWTSTSTVRCCSTSTSLDFSCTYLRSSARVSDTR